MVKFFVALFEFSQSVVFHVSWMLSGGWIDLNPSVIWVTNLNLDLNEYISTSKLADKWESSINPFKVCFKHFYVDIYLQRDSGLNVIKTSIKYLLFFLFVYYTPEKAEI